MSISNNKSEITNNVHNKVNISLINSEVTFSQQDIQSLIQSMLRNMISMVENQVF